MALVLLTCNNVLLPKLLFSTFRVLLTSLLFTSSMAGCISFVAFIKLVLYKSPILSRVLVVDLVNVPQIRQNFSPFNCCNRLNPSYIYRVFFFVADRFLLNPAL